MSERSITIAEQEVTISDRYAEGHVCSDADAKTLNQTRAENIRNNLAKHVKALVENGSLTYDDQTFTSVQALVDHYAGKYEFSMGGGSGTSRVVDPIEREARAIARDYIKSQLQAQGTTIKKYYATDTDEGKARYESKVVEVAQLEAVRKLAATNVREAQKKMDKLAAAIEGGEAAAA